MKEPLHAFISDVKLNQVQKYDAVSNIYCECFRTDSTYEVQTLLLNGVSVSDTHIGYQHSYDTCRTRICKMSNSKNIC